MPKSKKKRVSKVPLDIRLGVALAGCIDTFANLNPGLTEGDVKAALDMLSWGQGVVFLKP